VRLAVRSGIFPLYEVFNGIDYRIQAVPDGTDPARYYEKQKRFSGQEIDLQAVKRYVQEKQARLKQLAAI
jgi:hypothetical protein